MCPLLVLPWPSWKYGEPLAIQMFIGLAEASGPNYQRRFVQEACTALSAEGLPSRAMIDCSHDNSQKDYRRQREVVVDGGSAGGRGVRHHGRNDRELSA